MNLTITIHVATGMPSKVLTWGNVNVRRFLDSDKILYTRFYQ